MQPKCSATTVAGEPCQRPAMVGSDLCTSHAGVGTPPKLLTDELANELVGLLQAGNYAAVACRAVGISTKTFRDWMKRGAKGDEQYVELHARVERARAQAESRHVAVITKAAIQGQWQASAWLLEREFPDRWGRVSVRVRDESPPDEALPSAAAEDDPFAEIDELAERRSRRG